MKTVNEIRTENLNALAREYGGPIAFADFIGKDRSQVSQWLNNSIDSKTGKPRHISSASCRQIEAKCDKQVGWLDTPHKSTNAESAQKNREEVPISAMRIPLIDYVQAGIWSESADQHAMESGHESIITDLDLSGQAFALEIKGESMLPEFRPGDKIIVDPSITPEPGDFVIAVSNKNAVEFKQFRPRGINTSGEQVFELAPLNDNFPSMRSDVTPIVIIGTMVEHRRYRRKQYLNHGAT